MAMGNQSLHIIGKALGHQSHTSTQIYARLANDPVRQAMEKAQADMMVAAGLVSPADFVTAMVGQADNTEPEPNAAEAKTSKKLANKTRRSMSADESSPQEKKPRRLTGVK